MNAETVEVWRASLDLARPVQSRLFATLTAEERQHAQRFRFAVHRNRFVARRGILRDLLARRIGIPPEAVRLTYSPHGKPTLVDGPGAAVRFNGSSSGALAVIAFAQERELGIDVEQLRPIPGYARIARTTFSVREYREIRRLPPSRRTEAFLACWTRKEAFVKALGGGLSLPLHAFDVSCTPGRPARMIDMRPPYDRGRRWTITAFTAPGPFVGALVVEGDSPRVAQAVWHPEPVDWRRPEAAHATVWDGWKDVR